MSIIDVSKKFEAMKTNNELQRILGPVTKYTIMVIGNTDHDNFITRNCNLMEAARIVKDYHENGTNLLFAKLIRSSVDGETDLTLMPPGSEYDIVIQQEKKTK